MQAEKDLKRKQLFIFGAYGCGNKGDDAILQAISNHFSDCDLVATTGAYEDIASVLPVKSVRCRLNEGFSIPLLFYMVCDSIRIFQKLAQSDALLFGGGSLIHDLSPYNLPFMFLWHRLARILRKRVYYVCIGIGPVQTHRGKKQCGKWLNLATGLFPRDLRGAEICRTVGATRYLRVCDAALTYTECFAEADELLRQFCLKKGEYICVTASNWLDNENYYKKDQNDKKAEDTIAGLAESLRALKRKLGYTYTLVFIPSEARDVEIGSILRDKLAGEMICLPTSMDCAQVAGVVENSHIIVGMRMHPMIFALRQGIPVIPIAYDKKIIELMKLFGLSDNVILLEEICPENILAMAERIERDRERIIAEIQNRANENRALGEACFHIMRNELGLE